MTRHYRVWLQSADGLVGPKHIVKDGEIMPRVVTPIVRRLRPTITERTDPSSLTELLFSRRRYEYWKVEGRKLWYREVAE